MLTPTPGLPEFEYIKPNSLAAASKFLVEHAGEARPFMGGTDTFVRMRDGFWKEKYLVDVKVLDGMKDIIFDPQSGLTFGAAVSMNQIVASPDIQEHYPLLAEAAHSVASYQLRSRATIAGNICNSSPAGDTIGSCLVLDGVLLVHGVDGKREEPLSSFFVGPGKNRLKVGDIVTGVRFPTPPAGWAGKYVKLGRNAIGDLAVVGATAMGYPDASASSGYRFRLVLASVAPVPLRLPEAEKVLSEKAITEETIAEAAKVAMDSCTPIDDVRSCSMYRRHMSKNLMRQAMVAVWEKLNK